MRAQIDRRNHEIVLLQEELRIKDARMERVPPHRRPHYVPLERMAILELRDIELINKRINGFKIALWQANLFCYFQ